MSLVGTRPILQDELLKYELHHRARIAIKPGITGMWQVSGRSDITDFEEVVRLDTEYISNWNFGLDIDLLDLLHDFKQSGATWNAIGFQGRGYSKADGFLSAGGIRHDQICGKRIEVSSGAFRTRVIAFKIYRKICALHRTLSSFLTARYFAFFSSSISF